jgi:hypothetical protein
MAHTSKTTIKGQFEDGDRPIGEDFANLFDSCHNTHQDTDVTITGTLAVSGTGTIVGATSLKSSLNVASTLTVAKATILNKNLSVNGAAFFSTSLEVTGDTDLNSKLDVSGLVNLGATANPTLIRGTLQTKELATFDKSVHIKGDLRVDGNAYLSAGTTGVINVGDSADDSVDFNADIISHLVPNASTTYNLGSVGQEWNTLYINSISVETTVDGREVGADGIVLDDTAADMTVVSLATGGWDTTEGIVTPKYTGWDSTKSTVDAGVGYWNTASDDSLANKADLVNVIAASGGWDSTKSTVDAGENGWTVTKGIVDIGHTGWDDTRTTVNSLSNSWEETADINQVADDVVNIMAVSASWTNTHTTVSANSAQWDLNSIEGLDDVNTTGVTNNSILRYDDNTGKWVSSTTEDIKSSGTVTVLDGNNSAWDTATLILIDNDAPANTITFTGDRNTEHGNNTEVNNWSYTFGYSGVTTDSLAATVLANVINLATANIDLAITAEAVNGIVNLSQNVPGAGGNTNITGSLLAMNLISTTNFTGGENPDAFEDLDDTPGSYSGHANEFVKVNNAQTALEFISHDSAGWDDTRTTVKGFSALWEELEYSLCRQSAK